MALIKLMFFLYLAVCVVGAIVSVVIAAVDIWRWHPKEERVKIKPSFVPEPEPEPVPAADPVLDRDSADECEVIEDV